MSSSNGSTPPHHRIALKKMDIELAKMEVQKMEMAGMNPKQKLKLKAMNVVSNVFEGDEKENINDTNVCKDDQASASNSRKPPPSPVSRHPFASETTTEKSITTEQSRDLKARLSRVRENRENRERENRSQAPIAPPQAASSQRNSTAIKQSRVRVGSSIEDLRARVSRIREKQNLSQAPSASPSVSEANSSTQISSEAAATETVEKGERSGIVTAAATENTSVIATASVPTNGTTTNNIENGTTTIFRHRSAIDTNHNESNIEQGDENGGIVGAPLVGPEDEPHFNPWVYKTHQNYVVCELEDSDRDTRNRNLPIGFKGLACIHCHKKRFHKTARAMSDSKTAVSMVEHLIGRCSCIPETNRNEILHAYENKTKRKCGQTNKLKDLYNSKMSGSGSIN